MSCPRHPSLVVALAATLALLVTACSAPASSTDSPGTTTGSATAAPDPRATRPAAPTGELPVALQTTLRSALDQTMQQYSVPGAAVGVWVPGEGSWVTAAGRADVAEGVPVTTEMTWPLRSVTKSYTVTLILQLVDEKAITLDDTIDTYVDGVADGDTITLRQLADMSSGNADYTNADFMREFSKDPDRVFTLDELNGFALGQPAQFAPGAEKIYTNANTNLLGAVVEKVTKKPFVDALQERILTPSDRHGPTTSSTPAPGPTPIPSATPRATTDRNPSPPTCRSSGRPVPWSPTSMTPGSGARCSPPAAC